MAKKESEINVAEDVQSVLEQTSNPKIAAHSSGFFKTGIGEYGEGDVFRGIRVPVLRKVAAEAKHLPLSEVLRLLKSAYHEDRLTALIMMVQLFKTATERHQKEIVKTYLAHTHLVNGWDLVDASAHLILGPYFYERDRSVLFELAESSMLWERRISIMSTFWFIKQKDFRDSLLISRILLHDTEDLIQKAVGWMLREIGNRDREAEIGFLNEHYREMPRTMLRYAIEKFPEPLRLAYLKGTI
ncbi:DNA alkylation repair protein [bacterium]|nr:DNA alkylation repair protein [bacterium]